MSSLAVAAAEAEAAAAKEEEAEEEEEEEGVVAEGGGGEGGGTPLIAEEEELGVCKEREIERGDTLLLLPAADAVVERGGVLTAEEEEAEAEL